MDKTTHPALYQVNTRVLLTEISGQLQRKATLDDIPDALLDDWKFLGFHWIWMLSVWQTGKVARQISRTNPGWRKEFEETLTDLKEGDIPGSGFAIQDYQVSVEIGGKEALNRFRNRLKSRNMNLMLDFVPNHMAPDHPWVEQHPGFFIQGDLDLLERFPDNFMIVQHGDQELILAHGRDPYFPGWPDTIQLDYSQPAVRKAMQQTLQSIASLCDGVRCDMAMLLLPEVFSGTWNRPMEPFWPDAIREVKKRHPDFLFMGEVYWDLEWTMLEQGFDYVYDKRLYDRLMNLEALPVFLHLTAENTFQRKLTRFLENHDEPRVATELPWDIHQAAAIITYWIPGMKFFHEGQLQGWKKKVSPHLGRRPVEQTNEEVERFYGTLLGILREKNFTKEQWTLLECQPAWEGNPTHQNFLGFQWRSADHLMMIVVNYAPYQGQSYLPFPQGMGDSATWIFNDLMGEAQYQRNQIELQQKGLYLDIPGWGYHVFEVGKG